MEDREQSKTNCWAASLGDCETSGSREHILSQSVFDDDRINVQGLPWCKEEKKTIGLASFTSKILCTRHNSASSDLDAEAGRCVEIFRNVSNLNLTREKTKHWPWKIIHHTVNGRLLERWFLKTLINVTMVGSPAHDGSTVEFARPIEYLTPVVYGRNPFERQAGLYGAGRIGQQTKRDNIEIITILKHGKTLVAGLFSFWGYRFVLMLLNDGVPVPMNLGDDKSDWARSDLIYHIKAIYWNIGRHKSQAIEFAW